MYLLIRSATSLAVVLLLSVLITTSSFPSTFNIEAESNCINGVHFYTYGHMGCPYCKALKEFFETRIPGSSVFCDISTVGEYYDMFYAQTSYIVNHTSLNPDVPQLLLYRLVGAIPRTLVVRENKYILAVVVGAVEDLNFWMNLSCLEPSTRIPLFSGNTLVGYIELGTIDHSEFVEKWLPVATTPTSPVEQEFPQPIGYLILPVVAIVLGVVVILLARRFSR
ncbi:MAG: hypothetical protein QXJ18_04370 [Desulfurococcaceae archaeon]